MTGRTRLATAAALLLGACSGGGGGGGGGPPAGIVAPETVSAYCTRFWTDAAARWAACDRGSGAYWAAYYDPAIRCADPLQAVAAGRAAYQHAPAGKCLDFVATASCDALEAHLLGRAEAPDCLAAIAGTLAAGAQCYTGESCASDACGTDANTCPSTCGPRHAAGERCDDGYPCAAGLYCDGRHTATAYTCQPLAGQGVLCNDDADCQLGLYCDYGTPGVSCQPRETSGYCSAETQCTVDRSCRNQACVLPRGAGDSCTQGQNQCGAGLWCSGGVCVDGPVAGQPCTPVNGEQRPCVASACTSGTCVDWSAGVSCSLATECAPTLDCSWYGQCVPGCPEP